MSQGTFCVAWGCSNRRTKGRISFHKFPTDAQRRKQWTVALKRDGFQPTQYSQICRDHFTEDCFNPTGRLKHTAVPSVFNFPSHMQKKVKERKPPAQKHMVTEGPSSFASCTTVQRPASLPPGPSDHVYCISSPRKLKRKLEESENRAELLRKKLKHEQRKNQRLTKRVCSLTEIVKDLRRKDLVSDSCVEMLERSFSGVPLQLMQRLLSKKGTTMAFHPALKAFAMTLQFYSMKAYEFVRDTFDLGLPHTSTIRRWFQSVDGNVGFNRHVLQSLKRKVDEAKRGGREVLCALMLDEMSIKKHIEWDGEKVVGFVDIGNSVTDDSAPPATEALVFMLVCVNGSWKVPVGFFFIHGMSGKEKANLIRECLTQVAEVGVRVISLTCDGPSSHIAMLKELGASMDPENLDPSFPHPSSGYTVYVFLDVCHMLKLLRNSLATCGLLKDGNGDIIRWRYLEELHTIQEQEGLHLANKLRQAHLCWESQKMKVKLAAQVFSTSIADSLEFCRDSLRLSAFANVKGTVYFLRFIDALFDVLNSRNMYAKGMKGAMKPDLPDGACSKMEFLDNAFHYIKSLQDIAGNKMYATPKKTAFIGFMAAIKATQELYKLYVGEDKPLRYMLTYKMSQDHLELFFGAVRAAGGSNNNPTVRQFVACFKRMLMRHDIKTTTGNASPQDETTILQSASMISNMKEAVEDDTQDIMMARRYNLIQEAGDDELDDIPELPKLPDLSIFRESAVGYIAGFVTKMVKRKISCPKCQTALSVKSLDGTQPSHALVLHNDRGGLVKPSPSVTNICLETEKLIQKMLFVNKDRLPQGQGLPGALALSILEKLGGEAFKSLESHMVDTEPENNHVYALIKAVTRAYCKVRMHHLVSQQNTKIVGKNIRKQFSKLILFKHQ